MVFRSGLSGIFMGVHWISKGSKEIWKVFGGFYVMLKGFNSIFNGFTGILNGFSGFLKGGGWKVLSLDTREPWTPPVRACTRPDKPSPWKCFENPSKPY